MPELPEVEVARRNLQRWAKGHEVRGADADETRIVSGPRGATLAAVVGTTVRKVDRTGKNLLLTFAGARGEDVGVWSHLGMTGKWLRRRAGAEAPRFSHARLALDDGSVLHYCDMRRFGRMQIVPGARFDELPRLAALGPDPLRDGVDAAKLAERLARVRLPIKVALLDQRLLAGVGNIQATEACFRARVDPRRPARSLTRAEVRRLARAIVASIRYTITRFAASGAGSGDGDIVYVEEDRAANPFKVYGRAGQPCPRKNGTIRRIVQAGRSTFFCEACLAPPPPRPSRVPGRHPQRHPRAARRAAAQRLSDHAGARAAQPRHVAPEPGRRLPGAATARRRGARQGGRLAQRPRVQPTH